MHGQDGQRFRHNPGTQEIHTRTVPNDRNNIEKACAQSTKDPTKGAREDYDIDKTVALWLCS